MNNIHFFHKYNGRKIRKLNINRHKPIRIPDRTCQNKLLMTENSNNWCTTKLTDHLWLPFLDQQQ